MIAISCPGCPEDIEVSDPWGLMCEKITCTNCGTVSQLLYDESWDSESGEEHGWFYLEKIK